MTTETRTNRLKKALFAGIHNDDLKKGIMKAASGEFDPIFVETTGEGKGLLKTDAVNTIDAVMLDLTTWPESDIKIVDIAKACGGFITLLSRALAAKTPVIVTCKEDENPVMDLIKKMANDFEGKEDLTIMGPIVVDNLPVLIDEVLEKTNFESKIIVDEVKESTEETDNTLATSAASAEKE